MEVVGFDDQTGVHRGKSIFPVDASVVVKRGAHIRAATASTHHTCKGPYIVGTAVFLIKKDALERLKTDCTQTKTSWISTNDALSALLWRYIVRARTRMPEWRSRTSNLMYAMNIHSSPALNSGSPSSPPSEPRLANIVLYSINIALVPDLDISHELSTISALASTALNIRSAVQIYTSPDLVAQALQLVATIPDVRRLGLVYPTWLEHDVVISSFSRLPLYSTSWGKTFGEPENGELSVGVPKG
ncbi:hypothetical protein HYALB_00012516 [Hymenoscyphus albidus]|uniref:Uncharacterized protein n=1 Tax=Hymenoscyphus albidus TaxID=595503 RepID=A0A9N9LM32_9HELO|nr:hypothetical protein HYALB_00012516 [Hymenoscyphus albidus]